MGSVVTVRDVALEAEEGHVRLEGAVVVSVAARGSTREEVEVIEGVCINPVLCVCLPYYYNLQ